MTDHYKDAAHLHLSMLVEKIDSQEKLIDSLNKQMTMKNRYGNAHSTVAWFALTYR